MPPKVIAVDPTQPPVERLSDAVTALESGGVVALPTETFYGLAADAFDPVAMGRVNRLKRKPADAPVLLLLADAAQAEQVSDRLPDEFVPLAEKFWPGPLTLVVPAAPEVPEEVTGSRGTVAVRVPGLALPRRLAGILGRPLSGPSANRTGEPPCSTAPCVARTFPEGLAVILDGGPSAGGAPSTILDLSGERPRVLREGLLPLSALRPFLKGVDLPAV
jgi:L-threonylcarbamoyladenylate synthase